MGQRGLMGVLAVGMVAAITAALWPTAAPTPTEGARAPAPTPAAAGPLPPLAGGSATELGQVPEPEPIAAVDDRESTAVGAAAEEPQSWQVGSPTTYPANPANPADATGAPTAPQALTALAATAELPGGVAAEDTASPLPSPTEMEAHADEVILGPDEGPRGTEVEAHVAGRRPQERDLSPTEADPDTGDDWTAREPARPLALARGRVYEETRVPDPAVPTWRGRGTVTTPGADQ
ncbi:MAG: hypothetical protein R3F60_33815 [bacterium]